MKNLKEALRRGEVLIGPFCMSGSPTLVEVVGYAGFDFIIIDCEHAATSPFGTELDQLVRAAYASDIAPIVRTTRNDPGQILKALDFGAKAVVVPHVNTVAEAQAVASAGRYAPAGRRSACVPIRAAQYGFVDWPTYYENSLEDALIIPLIEEQEGVTNIEEIVKVDGLGGIFFGPFDFSVSVGRPGVAFEGIESARGVVYKSARSRGLPVADYAWNAESAMEMIDKGAQLIVLGTDLVMFGDSCRTLRREVESIKVQIAEARTDAGVPSKE